MSVLKASSSISSPSWKSIARLVLPSRLELNSPEGSLSEAPLRRGFALGRCALSHVVCTSFGRLSILRRYGSGMAGMDRNTRPLLHRMLGSDRLPPLAGRESNADNSPDKGAKWWANQKSEI